MSRNGASWLAKQSFWQIVGEFALLGLLAAAGFYVYGAFHDFTNASKIDSLIDLASIVFCPPSLLLVACIDCEAAGWDGFFTYSIIGILNAALYGLVGIIVAVSRPKVSASDEGPSRR